VLLQELSIGARQEVWGLFTGVRGIGILRSSREISANFAFIEFCEVELPIYGVLRSSFFQKVKRGARV
jgi:hypothetical protein